MLLLSHFQGRQIQPSWVKVENTLQVCLCGSNKWENM